MVDRPLTAGERQMVLGMFGPSIDVDAIRISDQIAAPSQNVPMVPTGEIVFWPNGLPGRPYFEDFSTAPLFLQGDFMHEITHIWQNQHGEQPARRAD